jgi:Protein of unknown function (DUF2796)
MLTMHNALVSPTIRSAMSNTRCWPRLGLTILLAVVPALVAGPVLAGKAHEHGVARADLAVEPTRITVVLDMPMDGLVGFERAPRDDAERKAVDAALVRLRNAAALFAIDPAAQCTPGPVVLTSAVLGLGKAPPPAGAKSDGHEDIEASYEFNCADGFRAGFVEVGLFEAFTRLKRIEVQAVTRKGQIKATLKRPSTRLTLAR